MKTFNEQFERILSEADEAGQYEADRVTPTPMTVTDGVQSWHVADGVCGFAWIWFKGNTAFGRYVKANGTATKAYPNGLSIWVSRYGQSMQRKEAYARAFAKVLQDNGIDAYARSRMD